MSPVFLQLGRAYSFDYPRYNYRLLPTTTETRRIVVDTIRDVDNEPLDGTTTSLNPLLQRGRWLVTGVDLDKDARRSFYSESMANIQPLSQDDLRPLKGVEYVVIEQNHVTLKTQGLGDALAYRMDHQYAAICAVVSVGARDINGEMDFDELDEMEFDLC